MRFGIREWLECLADADASPEDRLRVIDEVYGAGWTSRHYGAVAIETLKAPRRNLGAAGACYFLIQGVTEDALREFPDEWYADLDGSLARCDLDKPVWTLTDYAVWASAQRKQGKRRPVPPERKRIVLEPETNGSLRLSASVLLLLNYKGIHDAVERAFLRHDAFNEQDYHFARYFMTQSHPRDAGGRIVLHIIKTYLGEERARRLLDDMTRGDRKAARWIAEAEAKIANRRNHVSS